MLLSTDMSLQEVSDLELVSRFQAFVCDEREKLVLMLEHIAEMDRRKLFFHYSSLSSYLVEEHGMEEWLAERRIRAARMLKRFPEVKSKLESGKLNLTLLELTQGVAYREKLSDSEFSKILKAVSRMSCRAAQRELATRYPQSVELMHDQVRPLNGELSEVRFVASDALLDKLEEIRALLMHSHPKLSMAELIDYLATDYRERHHPEAKAQRAEVRLAKKTEVKLMKKQPSEVVKTPTAPRVDQVKRAPSSSLENQLIQKESYSCSYVDRVTQKRCTSKRGLEIDHIHAWSQGGKTELSNLRYLCANHHRRVSFLQFGESSKFSSPRRE